MNKYNNSYFTEKIYLKLKDIAPYFAFGILGFILCLVSYALLIFYKEYYITYARKDEKFQRGHYYKYIEYKAYIKHILCLSFIIISMWVVVMLIPQWRVYLTLMGMAIFFI